MLHIEAKEENPAVAPNPPTTSTTTPIPTHVALGIKSNLLLMTYRTAVEAPDGSSVEAQALLDLASSASFVSELLAQSLCLPRSHQSICISGVAVLMRNSLTQHITSFKVSFLHSPSRKFTVSPVIVPWVNPGRRPSEDFSRSNVRSIQRDTSKNLNLSWMSTLKQGMLNLCLKPT